MHRGKVLAVDYGKKMVGLASGDFELGLALPRDVLFNRGLDFLVAEIVHLCDELEVVLVVVGIPSTENPIVKDINIFVEALIKAGKKVELVDEDFSSVEAKLMMDGHQSGRLDANAAQVILQRFFDRV